MDRGWPYFVWGQLARAKHRFSSMSGSLSCVRKKEVIILRMRKVNSTTNVRFLRMSPPILED
jgi:hypothetical protein